MDMIERKDNIRKILKRENLCDNDLIQILIIGKNEKLRIVK